MTRRNYRRPQTRLGRRAFLAGLGAVAALPVYAEALLDGAALGLLPDGPGDQTAALRAAMEQAVKDGRPLFLPAGNYLVDGLEIPGGVSVIGVQGQSRLLANSIGPAARIANSMDVSLEGVGFMRSIDGGPAPDRALLEIESAGRISITRCAFSDSRGSGIGASMSNGSIDRCSFEGCLDTAIFSRDSIGGWMITNNRILGSGNGAIRIWGSAPGQMDGSIVLGNSIQGVYSMDGGNGQNGNGVNVFNADGVIVADNRIDGCAFTAVRLNATRDTQVKGNICTRCGEVAIFSEFGFSASVIDGNIVDQAAQGISITNLDQGGRVAVCSNNIVRNIIPSSPVNPDTRPVGIHVEAETTVTGNTVEAVPGVGISAGYGPYLRNVLIANNLVTGVTIGIAVSVADNPAPGAVRIAGNMISDAKEHAIVGMAWDEMVSDDLVRDAGKFPHVRMGDNTIVTL